MTTSNYVTQVTLPDGYTYEVRDTEAQGKIAELLELTHGVVHYRGNTSTAMTDGMTGNVTLVDGTILTASNATPGDIVIYTKDIMAPAGHPTGPREFIFDGSKWSELGSTGALKGMAFVSEAEGYLTPSGTISAPTFTGSVLTSTGYYTPNGEVIITTRTGDSNNNYTPQGSVSTPAVTVSPTETTVYSTTNTGVLPTCTMPVFSSHVNNNILTITWTEGSFSAGSLPITQPERVMTDVDVEVSQPTFSGIPAHIHANFTGTEGSISVTGTPQGTISTPSFTGITAKITVAPTITVTNS